MRFLYAQTALNEKFDKRPVPERYGLGPPSCSAIIIGELVSCRLPLLVRESAHPRHLTFQIDYPARHRRFLLTKSLRDFGHLGLTEA